MTFPILFFIRFSRLLLVSWQYYGMFTLYPIFFVLTIVRGKKAREFLFFVRKKEVCGSGFLGFSFLCAPHFELSPQTLLLQPTLRSSFNVCIGTKQLSSIQTSSSFGLSEAETVAIRRLKSTRRAGRHRKILRQNLFPQRHQHRSAGDCL